MCARRDVCLPTLRTDATQMSSTSTAIDTTRTVHPQPNWATSTIVDGNPAPGIHYPSAIATLPIPAKEDEFDLVVLDGSNRLYVIDKQGGVKKTIGGPGSLPGEFLCNPRGLAVSDDGQTAYVADTGNNRIQRFRLSDSSLQAQAGYRPQALPTGGAPVGLRGGVWKKYDLGSLSQPHGLALHGEKLYVSDTYNHRIVVMSTVVPPVTKASDGPDPLPELTPLFAFGSKGRDAGCFQYPKGLAIAAGATDDEPAELIVADTRNHRLQCFTLVGQRTRGVSGGGNEDWSVDAGRMIGSDLFSFPTNLAVSSAFAGCRGRFVFVSDQKARIIVLSLETLEPFCTLALSNPTRLRSASVLSSGLSPSAVCTHPPPRPPPGRNSKGPANPLPVYVAEYDEHTIREILIPPSDLKFGPEP